MPRNQGNQPAQPENNFKSLEDLERLVDASAPEWKELYSDHSKAAHKGTAAMKEDTTGLSDAEIYEEFGKYLGAYDSTIGIMDSHTTKEYRKEILKGKAKTTLEALAKGQKMDLQTALNTIRREGLSLFTTLYHMQSRGADVDGLMTSRIASNIELSNAAQVDSIIKSLQKDAEYKSRTDMDMKGNFMDYVKAHLQKYHSR